LYTILFEGNKLTGIFGTGAALNVDVNLALQVIMFVIIIISLFYKYRMKFKIHGVLMGIAVILHILTFLTVMGPIFFGHFSEFVDYISYPEIQTTWIHAIPGAIAIIMGILLVGLWALRPSNIAACSRRKRLMDVTVLLWLVSLIFGIATYILLYV
jgi:uncharacterized membrane protein YozB (DUF420 family)